MLKGEIIGNIGSDAVEKDFNGQKSIMFSVAHSEKYKDSKGIQVEKTIWVSCFKHGDSAIAQYLTKGTKVYIRGNISISTYKDKNEIIQPNLSVSVSEIQLLSSRSEESKPNEPFVSKAEPIHVSNPTNAVPTDGSDLPF